MSSVCVSLEPLVVVKSSAWCDNTLTTDPFYMCIYKNTVPLLKNTFMCVFTKIPFHNSKTHLFSVLLTHYSKIWELSDRNKTWKQIQTTSPWVHHFWVMSDKNLIIVYGNTKIQTAQWLCDFSSLPWHFTFFFFNGTLTFYLNYIYHKGGGYPGLPSPSCLCLENALNPTVLGHASNSMASR